MVLVTDPPTEPIALPDPIELLHQAIGVTCMSFGQLRDGVWHKSTGGIVMVPRRITGNPSYGVVTLDLGGRLDLTDPHVRVTTVTSDCIRIEYLADNGMVMTRIEYHLHYLTKGQYQ